MLSNDATQTYPTLDTNNLTKFSLHRFFMCIKKLFKVTIKLILSRRSETVSVPSFPNFPITMPTYIFPVSSHNLYSDLYNGLKAQNENADGWVFIGKCKLKILTLSYSCSMKNEWSFSPVRLGKCFAFLPVPLGSGPQLKHFHYPQMTNTQFGFCKTM